MIELLIQPWPWYISGPLIAIIMILLLYFGGSFGVSSNLRSICSIAGAGKKTPFFNYNWKDEIWNLIFILGAVIGGFISSIYLKNPNPININIKTINDLKALGISFDGNIIPHEIFNWEFLFSLQGFLILILGGFFVGFGSRWAGGCTSGHAINGLSNLQIPSLIAVIGFFIGGLIVTYFIYPLIF